MVLDTHTARELTAGWISPADTELCRFATGHDRNPGSVVDWEEFIAELEACRPYADANVSYPTAEESHAQLDQLTEYAQWRLSGGRDY